MELTLSLDSLNKLYYAGEHIQGNVLSINKSKFDLKYKLLIRVMGYYSFYNTRETPVKKKTFPFYKKNYTIVSDSYSSVGGNNNTRFKFPLNSDSCEGSFSYLYESYKGAKVSVTYEIYAEALSNGKQFISNKKTIIVMVPGQGISPQFGRKRMSYQFTLTPENIESIKIDKNAMPKFLIECYLENINCCIDKPFNGFCTIKECSTEIKSIELQFLRNEKILNPEFQTNAETSEIQNLQIGDGDVIRNLEIPVFMIFPRNFCCANLKTKDVELSFEMNLIIVLVNGVIIMENYPVNLWRS